MAIDTLREADIIVGYLRSAVMEGGAGLKDVPGLLKRTIDEELWRERIIIRTGEMVAFHRFIDFVTAQPLEGLGADVATLRRLCADDMPVLNAIDRAIQAQHGGDRSKSYSVRLAPVEEVEGKDGAAHDAGNRADYALRRLRKDRSDLHTRVLAGELSPHAAMVEAGYRRRTITLPADVPDAARALRRHFTAAQIAALIAALTEPSQ